MSYDVNVSVTAWGTGVNLSWLEELRRMGVELACAADFDPATSTGWLPVTVTVTTASLPLARELRALGTFTSGFEYHGSASHGAFVAKSSEGNAVLIWCAAALAAVAGGTLDDPQFGLSATGATGAEIIAQLVHNRDFVNSICGPQAVAPHPARKRATAPKAKAAKPTVEADLSRPVKPYSASATFDVADRIEHASFGEGVVEKTEPGKIAVFFTAGRRVLVQAKVASGVGQGLQPPRAFDHSKPSPGHKPH
jgi:hypothetical protein